MSGQDNKLPSSPPTGGTSFEKKENSLTERVHKPRKKFVLILVEEPLPAYRRYSPLNKRGEYFSN
jgi:hypothetical protein